MAWAPCPKGKRSHAGHLDPTAPSWILHSVGENEPAKIKADRIKRIAEDVRTRKDVQLIGRGTLTEDDERHGWQPQAEQADAEDDEGRRHGH